jgi:hypothetical protein
MLLEIRGFSRSDTSLEQQHCFFSGCIYSALAWGPKGDEFSSCADCLLLLNAVNICRSGFRFGTLWRGIPALFDIQELDKLFVYLDLIELPFSAGVRNSYLRWQPVNVEMAIDTGMARSRLRGPSNP